MRTRKRPGIGEPRAVRRRRHQRAHAQADFTREGTRARGTACVPGHVGHPLSEDRSGDPSHPANVGKRVAVAVGKSRALAGLRQAVNDCLEDLEDVAPEQVSQLGAEFRDAGIVTATELGRWHSRRYAALLRRGTIRDEAGSSMVKAVLDDVESGPDEDGRTRLGATLIASERAGTGA